MTKNISEEDRLFDEAVDIMIRVKSDPDNPVALETASRWLSRGHAHQKVWAEVLEIHGMSGKILTDQRRQARKDAFTVSRRTLVVGGLLGTGGLLAAAYSGPQLILEARADYITGTAEIRRIALPDGSYATLGPDTAITIDIGERNRDVDLLQGMAYFEVMPDPSRPFSARSEGLKTTALGTAFDLSSDAGLLNVAVSHGLVRIDLPSEFNRSDMRLKDGEWLSLSRASGQLTQGTREVGQIASWRDGLIVIEKEPIASVVARIARWKRGTVIIASRGFGNQLVSGVFDLKDPGIALDAVVQPYGGKVRELTPYLTVISAF